LPFNIPYSDSSEEGNLAGNTHTDGLTQQHVSMSSTSSSSDDATVRFTSRDDSATFLEESERECEGMSRAKPNDAKLIRHALKCCRKKERKLARNWWEQLDGPEIAPQPAPPEGEQQVPLKSCQWARFKVAFVRLFPAKNKARQIGKFQSLKQTGPVAEFNGLYKAYSKQANLNLQLAAPGQQQQIRHYLNCLSTHVDKRLLRKLPGFTSLHIDMLTKSLEPVNANWALQDAMDAAIWP
jgi:hypothetical protein